MEDNDGCPICFNNFTLPKILSCGHTFCLQCLKDYAKQFVRKPNDLISKYGIVCPLCRSECKIPEKGIQDMVTNYFFPSSPIPCECDILDENECETEHCSTCFKNVCIACYRSHYHGDEQSSDNNDSGNTLNPRLPFYLIFSNIQTEYICELVNTFSLDVPSDKRGRRPIISVLASRFGGAYVLPETVPFILKFTSHGTLQNKIRTPEYCNDITELENGDILGIFARSRFVLRFTLGGWAHFTSLCDFFAYGVTELSDGKILLCGLGEIRNENLTESVDGIIRKYSADGDCLECIEQKNKSTLFAASNKRAKTFAVADQKNHSVTTFKENGEELSTYNGSCNRFCLSLLGMYIDFHPVEMCCSPSGRYIVSSSDGTLHLLTNQGKLCGIALSGCADGFGHLTDIAVDTEGNIWCSNSDTGTIKIFRLVSFKNHLNRTCY